MCKMSRWDKEVRQEDRYQSAGWDPLRQLPAAKMLPQVAGTTQRCPAWQSRCLSRMQGSKCEMEVHTEKSICNFILFFFNDEKKLLRANGIGWITDGQNGTRICKPHQRDAVPSSMWAVLSTLKEKWEILIFSLCEKWHHYPCVWEADFIPNNIILPESFQALRWIFFSEPLPFCISQCTADVNRHGTSQPGTISSPAVGQRLCHVCRAIWHILSLTQQIRSAS